jgi:FkbM family methyltransferase
MSDSPYRFSPGIGWLTHVWKSAVLQDHAYLRAVLRPLLPENGVAIDVGAHGGQITRLLADLVPRGLVVAVEPSGYTRSVLRPALWVRRITNVVVIAAALGAEPDVAMLRTPIKRRGDMGYGLANLGPAQANPGVAEAVAVTTMDALVAALALPRVDFVKADIEGFEAAMVAGAHATLARFRPALLLEHDNTFLCRSGASNEAFWTDLVALGYRPHRLPAAGTTPTSIESGPQEGDILWLARD